MWRYAPVLPLDDGESPVSLGEGVTPLHRAARSSRATSASRGSGSRTKACNPTASFKARGHERGGHARAGRSAFRASSCRPPATPARRSPRTARPRRDSRARLRARHDAARRSSRRFARSAPSSISSTATSATRASRRARSPRRRGYFDVSTLREPYRIEGKKTMGIELAEQLGWTAADAHRLSDRRRDGTRSACGRCSPRCAMAVGSRRTSRCRA